MAIPWAHDAMQYHDGAWVPIAGNSCWRMSTCSIATQMKSPNRLLRGHMHSNCFPLWEAGGVHPFCRWLDDYSQGKSSCSTSFGAHTLMAPMVSAMVCLTDGIPLTHTTRAEPRAPGHWSTIYCPHHLSGDVGWMGWKRNGRVIEISGWMGVPPSQSYRLVCSIYNTTHFKFTSMELKNNLIK